MKIVRVGIAIISTLFFATASIPSPAQTITVNPGSVVRPVTPLAWTVNADAFCDLTDNTSFAKTMGFKGWRFGGNEGDEIDWKTMYNAKYHVTVRTSVKQWLTDMAESGASAGYSIFCVNYGSGTPAEAAGFVAYVERLGYHPIYWEVGNECYGDWQFDLHAIKQDPTTYAREFPRFYAAMKAVDPQIKIGIPVVQGEDRYAAPSGEFGTRIGSSVHHFGWDAVVLTDLREEGVTPDWIQWHGYAESDGTENDAKLLAGYFSGDHMNGFADEASAFRAMLNNYLPHGSKVQILNDEFNSNGSNPGKQTVSIVDALYMAVALGSSVQTEIVNNTWFCLVDTNDQLNRAGNNSPSLYGWRNYGDDSLVQGAPDGKPGTCYPTFYVAEMLNKWITGSDRVVTAVSSEPLLKAYAIRHANGSVGILVVNTSPSSAYPSTVSLLGRKMRGSAFTLSYGLSNDNAARTGVGNSGLTHGAMAISGASLKYRFAPYSVTLINLPASGSR